MAEKMGSQEGLVFVLCVAYSSFELRGNSARWQVAYGSLMNAIKATNCAVVSVNSELEAKKASKCVACSRRQRQSEKSGKKQREQSTLIRMVILAKHAVNTVYGLIFDLSTWDMAGRAKQK